MLLLLLLLQQRALIQSSYRVPMFESKNPKDMESCPSKAVTVLSKLDTLGR